VAVALHHPKMEQCHPRAPVLADAAHDRDLLWGGTDIANASMAVLIDKVTKERKLDGRCSRCRRWDHLEAGLDPVNLGWSGQDPFSVGSPCSCSARSFFYQP